MLHIAKKRKFEMLVENAARCDLCDRMRGRTKVLSEKNGDLDARVVFVGEAPGRLGADRTHVPFYGDQAGRNFNHLLKGAGLKREDTFATNAVLCNPRDGNGNNAAPTWNEIRNCSVYLGLALDVVQPEIVVPMGHWALNALDIIEPHPIQLRRDVGRPFKWTKYTLLPMYHPGPRAVVHRRAADQMGDFQALAEILGIDQAVGRRLKRQQIPLLRDFESSLLQKIIFRIVQQMGSVSRFKLAKLLYLLDWQELRDTGDLLTDCYYIFQKDGPLATGLSKALEQMHNHEVSPKFRGRTPVYYVADDVRCDMDLPEQVARKVDSLVDQYRDLSNAQTKTRAYLTDPMKTILRRQRQGEHMLNHPVFEGWINPNRNSG